ncbi:MAG: 50S ribosomal protein L30 [Pseudomonadales bacterium]|nr:50S ribosomal protein L30 [Pseudomonadales bacterium]
MPVKIKVKLTKSFHGRLKKHKSSVRGLGLSRINQVVEVEDTPSVRGMIDKVNYMVKIQGE